MPSSDNHGKAWISVVFDLLPHGSVSRVLDVGTGGGRYAENLRHPAQHWMGIEVWGPYLDKYALRQKYDKIIIADARYVDYSLFDPFDVVFCGDVLEHMEKAEAVALTDKLLHRARFVFISLPITLAPQGAVESNPFEVHVKDDWTIEEARASFPSVTVSIVHETIGVLVLASDLHDKEIIIEAAQKAYKILAPESS